MDLGRVGLRAIAAWSLTAVLLLSGSALASGRPAAERPATPLPDRATYVEGQVLVAFAPSIGTAGVTSAHSRTGARPKKRFKSVPGLELVALPSGASVEQTVAQYEAMPGVLYAEPNYTYQLAISPNDPLLGQLWGLHNTGQTGGAVDADIDAVEAWDSTTGSAGTLVAVVDTGVDYEHPDLAANIWTNPGETPGIGVDDDGNGYVDDVHGIDPADGDGDPLASVAFEGYGHGTHVAGTIGASGDSALGITGVNWDVSMLALKIFDSGGDASVAAILAAWEYAHDQGVTVLNNSWGGNTYSASMYNAIASYPDMLFVCAAGNGGTDGIGDDNDVVPYYPASYNLANVLSVGASDHRDLAAGFSNYGDVSVDVFAPGVGITSAIPAERAMSIAPDAVVNDLTVEGFNAIDSLDNWDQFYSLGVPFEPWAIDGTSFRSSPSSASILDYEDNQLSILRPSAPMDLATADHPGMRFHARTDTQANADYLQWGATDGGWEEVVQFGQTSGDSEGDFVEFVVDLEPYSGRSDMFPWFAFDADGSSSSDAGYAGLWLDDVEVFDLDAGPSGDVWVTTAGDYASAYQSWDGTSMASPHVAGIAGLLLSADPSLTPASLKAAIMDGADAKASLAGRCLTGARVNANGALAEIENAPVAVDDGYTTAEDAQIVVPAAGVLANDTDPESDPLTAAKVSGPSHGTAELSTDGSFIYTPAPDYAGPDSFTYKASDGTRVSNEAVVSITVTAVNDAPIAYADGYTTPAGTPLSVPASGVLGNDADVDTPPAGLTAVKLSDPGHGTLAEFNPNGSFTYSPGPGYSGTDAFTYQANDGTAGSNPVTVTITVTPAAPVVTTKVYRFYNGRLGTHFYTADEAEKTNVQVNLSGTYSYEGVGYTLNPSANSVALFRFYRPSTGTHFYTASVLEMLNVKNNLSHIYAYEGPAYNVSADSAGGTKPAVHRFYNFANGTHFYTADPAEKANVETNLRHIYSYDGVAFYLGQ